MYSNIQYTLQTIQESLATASVTVCDWLCCISPFWGWTQGKEAILFPTWEKGKGVNTTKSWDKLNEHVHINNDKFWNDERPGKECGYNLQEMRNCMDKEDEFNRKQCKFEIIKDRFRKEKK